MGMMTESLEKIAFRSSSSICNLHKKIEMFSRASSFFAGFSFILGPFLLLKLYFDAISSAGFFHHFLDPTLLGSLFLLVSETIAVSLWYSARKIGNKIEKNISLIKENKRFLSRLSRG